MKDVRKSNRLIADFMGVEITYIKSEHGQKGFWIAREGELNPPFPSSFLAEDDLDFIYHKSFDTLMPVVKKISTLLDDGLISEFFRKTYDHWIKELQNEFWDVSKLYNTNVEFINWYNEHK